MSLIVSVSGIRGTIGGRAKENLTPVDVLTFSTAYGLWLKSKFDFVKVCIGMDSRPSGSIVSNIVAASLSSLGIDVIDLGLTTTPSLEMAIILKGAQGGIMITASHNPVHWNALKLLNERGEFISAADGQKVKDLANLPDLFHQSVSIQQIGKISEYSASMEDHIKAILSLPNIPISEIRNKRFRIIADCINSTAALALPILFRELNCEFTLINGTADGQFNHNPEPLEGHLGDLIQACRVENYDLGIAVDPDVDRLAIVDELGQYIGEEYTLVTASDFVLSVTPGPVVNNLSSSRALRDLAQRYHQQCFSSAVGEAHVVAQMKESNAVIGGEGNGGVIYPELHYGRDALLGIVLVLARICNSGMTMSQLRSSYHDYFMVKDKIELDKTIDFGLIQPILESLYPSAQISTVDGIKIDFEYSWVHLRKSNTEPIVRIYAEAMSISAAEVQVTEIKNILLKMTQSDG